MDNFCLAKPFPSFNIFHIMTAIFLAIATFVLYGPFLTTSCPNFCLKYDSFVLAAAHAACTKILRKNLFPFVIALLLNLPALSSFLGHNHNPDPIQFINFLLSSKAFISEPASAIN